MAKEKGHKQRTTNPRSAGETSRHVDKRSSVWASRLRAVVILLVVGAGAIFSGYAVGNYVMDRLFGDKNAAVTRVATSGTNNSSGSPGSVSNVGTLDNRTTTSDVASTATTSGDTTSTGPTSAGASSTTGTSSTMGTTTGAHPTSTNAGGGAGLPSASEHRTTGAPTAAPTSESEVLYRVRVGAFATPEEAEPDLRLLKERGYADAYVVKSDDGSAYHIQVGAFSSSRSAFNVEEQLRAAGFAVHIETVQRR